MRSMPAASASQTRLPMPGGQKMAEGVATEIENEIIARGWPVGEVLGSEAELLDRFGVSRAVLREAIRLLEHHQVATMRRGPGGGLIVRRPHVGAVTRSVALYLDYEHVTSTQLFEARVTVELVAAQLASERITEEGVEELRRIMQTEQEQLEAGAGGAYMIRDLHTVIAGLTGNPAIRLFVETLTELTAGHAIPSGSVKKRHEDAVRSHDAHEKIVEAIIAGDPALARHRMLRHLEALAPHLG
jgi:DNA-binding FadR family transcriptional regulator